MAPYVRTVKTASGAGGAEPAARMAVLRIRRADRTAWPWRPTPAREGGSAPVL